MEVVSPILYTDPDGAWRRKIQGIFAHIQTKCTLATNETCGFHVHLSPGSDEPWSVAELRSISFAIFYFDEAMLALMPVPRRKSYYHHSNRFDNRVFSGLTLGEC